MRTIEELIESRPGAEGIQPVSLERALEPEMLVTGHFEPIVGAA